MSRVTVLYEQAFKAAEDGHAAESENDRPSAIQSFEQAVQLFSRLAMVETSTKRTLLEEHIRGFQQRIQDLRGAETKDDHDDAAAAAPTTELVLPSPSTGVLPVSTGSSCRASDADDDLHGDIRWQNASRLEQVAQSTEVDGDLSVSIDLYMKSADELLEVDKNLSDAFLCQRVRTKVESIIDRITALKERHDLDMEDDLLMEEDLLMEVALGPENMKLKQPSQPSQQLHPPLPQHANPNQFASSPSSTYLPPPPHAKYTAEEVDVLRRSSVINGRLFQPWMDSDTHVDVAADSLFVDPDGFLAMSPKQLDKLAKWSRPSDYGTNAPRMVSQISPYAIVQDVVTDCSFVASLCITAAYELRFHKQLITNIIYPQVSIVEKAYLKVNGGYDFPGSNSGIDLFALTGWIPESLAFGDQSQSSSDIIWQRLMSAHNFGDCLITIATDDMPKPAKRVGLVPSHAYAVLNVVETSNRLRLLLVKNPWNRKRWRGPFGMDDRDRWTDDLQRELNFDWHAARQSDDDGLFWIDFASVQVHFSALFLNWNPDLFRFRYTVHKHWPVDVGPQNDTYNLGYNPQYRLTFFNPDRHTKVHPLSLSVWILLSRHVTAAAVDTPQQFLTLHVFKQAHRVFYPNHAFTRGTYSNNPHALTCVDIQLTADESETTFVLVASQFEKLAPLDYTLSVFSTDGPFELTDAPETPPHRINLMDAWTSATAGGCPNFMERMLLTLEAPVDLAINLRLVGGDGQRVGSVSKKSLRGQSGEYRPGFCYLDLDAVEAGLPSGQLPDATANPTTAFLTSAKGAYTNSTCGVRTPLAHVPPGYYLVIPSTFEPRRGDFDLHGYANLPVTTSRLR
ncbi:hypothetical protein DYB35_004631 [Aphanomyces astaci]|uniref:Calpain catalytic domain-containing protein n=1 Tax=Aphanomyces astaci TaxID=112090 RepID=A0A418D162_APHAT|nr:hypothetical protein DYB35_004631 [Aphanomyces astaci]